MPAHNLKTLLARVTKAGIPRPLARCALVPDWWGPESDEDGSLADVEERVARFLRMPLSQVRDPAAALALPAHPGAQLKNARHVSRAKLDPAIHFALMVAKAALPCLRDAAPVRPLPRDPLDWRAELLEAGPFPDLAVVLENLWARGYLVLHVSRLPTPRFQGLAALVNGRPVILLSHDLEPPAVFLFNIAHEAGHHASGHCTDETFIVDGEENDDRSETEVEANRYARLAMLGRDDLPSFFGDKPRQLAQEALDEQARTRADAGLLLRSWAFENGTWALASAAIEAIDQDLGGPETVRAAFEEHIDRNLATDAERGLLACLDEEGGT